MNLITVFLNKILQLCLRRRGPPKFASVCTKPGRTGVADENLSRHGSRESWKGQGDNADKAATREI